MSIYKKLKWKYLRYIVYLDRHNLSSYLLPLILFVVTIALLAVGLNFYHYTNVWTDWRIAENNALTFCEHNRFAEAIVQPANTWSNIGYLIVGLLCMFIGINDIKSREPNITNLLVRYPAFSIMIGISCIYLFFGSFLYHASLAYTFQKLDITGMYAVAIAFIGYNVFRFFPTRYAKLLSKYRSNHHVIITVGILLNVVFFMGLWKVNVNVLFPIVVLVLIILNVLYKMRSNHISKIYQQLFNLSILLLLSATVFWVLDRQNVLCSPTSIWQGHAFWHILNSSSIFLLYLCYRTETVNLEAIYKNKENVFLYYK